MKKGLFPLVPVVILFSGCVGTPGGPSTDLSIVSTPTFAAFPYTPGPLTLCRTPVPRPSLMVVSRTVRSLAGAGGQVKQVPIPTGVAFGIWSDKTRIAAIRGYLNQLNRERRITLRIRLSRIGKRLPYLDRSFFVLTNRPFLAAAWDDGPVTRTVSGFFLSAGQDVVPVLDLTLLAPGFRSCRTATPDLPGRDIVFGARKAIIKKGATNLEITWETVNDKN
ncbi:hypothetical protein [Leptospirillum ferriphilum]|uniref:hypothetical protein n=1 Tax=Leptospirillum ferriphilum TaxID=178606 RepID=UPI000986A1A3|nr:hypothetical protein [Leptospirillum ferriphilum]OOH80882.1 hypothetical protein BOX30_05140 [Leptospirillum ferriphilum]